MTPTDKSSLLKTIEELAEPTLLAASQMALEVLESDLEVKVRVDSDVCAVVTLTLDNWPWVEEFDVVVTKGITYQQLLSDIADKVDEAKVWLDKKEHESAFIGRF